MLGRFASVLLVLSALGWSASAAAQQVGVPYSTTYTASGGFPPYTWTRTAGTLPPGLTLASNGVLSGTPTAAGSFAFTLRVTDTQGNWGTGNFTVTVAPPTITLSPATLPPGAVAVAYSQTLTTTGGMAPHTYTVASGALPPGITLSAAGAMTGTPTAGGTFAFTLRATDSNAAGPYSGTQAYTLTIAKVDQTIAFGLQPDQVFSPGGTFALNPVATASSGLPVSYSAVTPAICSISGTTVTMLSAGTCHIAATQAGDATYNPEVFAQSIEITPASQAITGFGASPSMPTFAPGGTFTVSATGGASTSPVSFGSNSTAVCTVSGNTVTILSAGMCALTADQAGDGNYTAAPQATLDVAIGPANQAITAFVATPAAPTYAPGATFDVSATAGASTSPVTFGSSTPSVCTVGGNMVSILSAGTCSLTADQAGDGNYSAAPQASLDVAIAAASQAITNFVATATTTVFAPGATFDLAATAGPSTSPVVFASTTPSVCSVSGSTVTILSAGTCSLTADQAADANYTAASQQTLDVAIAQAGQAIGNFIATPNVQVYAVGATFGVSATGGGSTSPVVFGTTTSSVCSVSGNTVSILAAGTCTLTADQAGDANYTSAAQATIDVAIGLGIQAITNFIATPGTPVYAPNGTFSVSATGGASTNAVTFASHTASVCTISGTTVTMLASGRCTLAADQAGNANYLAAPRVTLDVAIGGAMPTLAWIADRDMIVGQASFDLPNPGSPSTGAFTFRSSNPEVATVSGHTVTVVGPGVTTLIARQAAAGSYLAAEVSATLTVSARPDPTRDAEVVGGLQAQVDTSVRFAAAQQANVRDRLRQLRGSDGNPSRNGMTLNLMGHRGAGLSLPATQVAADDDLALPQGWGFWTAGAIVRGERDARTGAMGFDFHSDGVTFGFDRAFGAHAVFGLAGGFGWDETTFASTSRQDAEQRSLTAYGIWRGAEGFYVEGTLGTGRLDFDLTRWSQVAGTNATARRDGDQDYGSLAIGMEHVTKRMKLTGYGRYDQSSTTFDAYRETGLGIYDLSYGDQSVDSRTLAFGIEGSHWMQGASIAFRPYWMLEYRESLRNEGNATINYVVRPLASDYVLGLRSYNDDALVFGAGVDMELFHGWALSVLFRREHSDNAVDSNAFGLRLTWKPAATPAAATAPAAALDMGGVAVP